MGGTAIVGGLELNCTFAEGSQAQSCILTVCRMEIDIIESCWNITISRDDPQTSARQTDLQPGVYVVSKVAEVESDDQIIIHSRRDVLNLTITESASATTFTTPG